MLWLTTHPLPLKLGALTLRGARWIAPDYTVNHTPIARKELEFAQRTTEMLRTLRAGECCQDLLRSEQPPVLMTNRK